MMFDTVLRNRNKIASYYPALPFHIQAILKAEQWELWRSKYWNAQTELNLQNHLFELIRRP